VIIYQVNTSTEYKENKGRKKLIGILNKTVPHQSALKIGNIKTDAK
jgi:hypothetical protein